MMTDAEHVQQLYRRDQKRGLFWAVLVAAPFIIYSTLGIVWHARTGTWPHLWELMPASSDHEPQRR
jgi:hypothetical protein